MRQVALDVHQGFCEVAIREDGKTRSAGRLATGFAGSQERRSLPPRVQRL